MQKFRAQARPVPADDPTVAPAAPLAPAPETAAPAAAVPESPAPAPTPEANAEPASAPTAEPTAGEPPKAEEATAPGETPPEPEKPKLHTDTPTIMELAGKEQQPKAPESTEAAREAPQPRAYEAFTLPDGLSLNPERVTEAATSLFAADNLSQERAQAYVDFHVAEMQRFADQQYQANHDRFAEMRADWVKQVMADPEMGGSRFQTAMTSIAIARDLFVSNAEPTSERYQKEMQEFNDMLRTTGAGDHPAFNRLLLNVARKWQEPAAPSITFKPPPDIGRRPNGAGSRRQAMYGTVDPTPRG